MTGIDDIKYRRRDHDDARAPFIEFGGPVFDLGVASSGVDFAVSPQLAFRRRAMVAHVVHCRNVASATRTYDADSAGSAHRCRRT